ncbi:uncharacterized protein BX664DRAFT_357105 [Halteromyces radiatus]|uniref:uncharacterized protein n=1 Tax=Halteromyces radiatus TaxID=101107 RepID=UPI00221FF148|nr:uncharacterized protein BX664DRAFT_357105 [Halteromyces radiatus]KAI8092575.1 hypothetical protein BX664DRAFT_357105 [Halteromyces radiatus]
MEQQPLNCQEILQKHQTNLLMAWAELSAKQDEWKEVQVYVKRLQQSLASGSDITPKHLNRLLSFCINVASSLIYGKDYNQALQWIISFCSSYKDYIHCEHYLLTRLLQLICHFLDRIKERKLDQVETHRLLELLAHFPEKWNTELDYHCAKIMILLLGPVSSSHSLEKAVFEMMENMDVVTESTIHKIQRLGTLLLHQTGKLSFDRLVGALDLYIQRCLINIEPCINNEKWIMRQADTIDETRYYDETIKAIMQENSFEYTHIVEMYLVKDQLETQDIWNCQMILWTTGDKFFEHGQYMYALVWYSQIWSLSITLPQMEDKNLLVLARKITACHIQQRTLENASVYIERAIGDTGDKASAIDYLLLLEVSIHLKNVEQAHHYIDKLITVPTLTMDNLLTAGHLCYKNEQGRLMQKITDYAFSIAKEYESQEVFKRNLMILFRWTIRFAITGKYGHDNNPTELLVDKDSILKYMKKGADYFGSMTGELSQSLQQDRDWVLRTSWNLGLQFYGNDLEMEGAALFKNAYKLLYQLFSTFYDQLTLEEKMIVCAELISMIKNYLDLESDIFGSDTFASIITLIQVQCYTTLENFTDAMNSLELYDQRLISSNNVGIAHIYEWLAGIILQHERCPSSTTISILKMVSSRFQQFTQYDGMMDKWARWNRMFISTSMMTNENKEDAFVYIEKVYRSISEDHLVYPQKEIHYLVVITWNEGITRLHSSDEDQAHRWCKLCIGLLSYLDSSHTNVKTQMLLELFSRSNIRHLPHQRTPVELRPLIGFVATAVGTGLFVSTRKLRTDPDLRSHAASYLAEY